METIPVPGTVGRTARITLGLFEDVLGVHGDFLGLDDAEKNSVYE